MDASVLPPSIGILVENWLLRSWIISRSGLTCINVFFSPVNLFVLILNCADIWFLGCGFVVDGWLDLLDPVCLVNTGLSSRRSH